MEIRLHTRHAQLDDRFRGVTEQKVSHAARLFDNIGVADVEISEEQNPRLAPEKYRVEITTSAAGQLVRVESAAPTMDSALDLAVDRFEQQLRRLKDRLVKRSRQPKTPPPMTPAEELLEQADDADEDFVIVRTKQFVMKPMTAEEAVLQLEMLGHVFFLFNNVDTGLTSLVYSRRDGAYGLIEPA